MELAGGGASLSHPPPPVLTLETDARYNFVPKVYPVDQQYFSEILAEPTREEGGSSPPIPFSTAAVLPQPNGNGHPQARDEAAEESERVLEEVKRFVAAEQDEALLLRLCIQYSLPPPQPKALRSGTTSIVPVLREALVQAATTDPPLRLALYSALQRKVELFQDWNERFQRVLREPDSIAKFKKLSNLAQNFVFTAEQYGRIIIEEYYLPLYQKTLRPGISFAGAFIGSSVAAHFHIHSLCSLLLPSGNWWPGGGPEVYLLRNFVQICYRHKWDLSWDGRCHESCRSRTTRTC